MPFTWPYTIYFLLLIIILPVYILIIICLLRLRRFYAPFQTTFYAILVQNSIADILALTLFAVQKLLCYFIPDTLLSFRSPYLAAFFYYTVFWLILIRSHGIFFLAIHRYLRIVKPHTNFSKQIQHFSVWKLWCVYWIPPLLLNLVFFSDMRVKFVFRTELQTSPEFPEVTNKNTLNANILLSLTSLTCVFCYIFISKLVRESSDSLSRSMRRELKLALQVFILVTAQIIILIFFALINIYSEPAQNETVMFIKTLTPYFYGLPSYFSPFTMIFFNREFSKQLRKMVTGRKMEVQVDTSVASSGLWKAGGSQNVRSLAVAPTSSRLQTARVNGSMTSITKI